MSFTFNFKLRYLYKLLEIHQNFDFFWILKFVYNWLKFQIEYQLVNYQKHLCLFHLTKKII